MPTKQFMQPATSAGKIEPAPDNLADSSRRLQGLSSAHFLKLVEERGEIGFWSVDFATDYITKSVGFCRILDIDTDLLLSLEDLIELIHPDDRSIRENLRETLQFGLAIDQVFRIVRTDGTTRWVRNKAETIVDTNGRAICAIGVMFDITAEREARLSVEWNIDRYRTLMAAVSAFVWKADRNGNIEVAREWCDLTGQTRDQAQGVGWLDAVHPKDRDVALATWTSAVSSRDTYEVESRVRHADGVHRRLSTWAAPILDPDGAIREWVGIILRERRGERKRALPEPGCPAIHTDPRLRAAQLRAARALLSWSLKDLALAANISISSIQRMESGMTAPIRQSVVDAARRALEEAGVEFTFAEDGRAGVRRRCQTSLSEENL